MTRLRVQRVNELVQRVLAEAISKSYASNIPGFFTIKSVSTNRDFSQADVFYSIFGSDDDVVVAQEVLDDARSHLQSEVARSVRLRNTPQLTFIHDDGEVRASRIHKLLDDALKVRDLESEDATTVSSADNEKPKSADM